MGGEGADAGIHYDTRYNSIINKVLKKKKGQGINSCFHTENINGKKPSHTLNRKMDTKHCIR